MFFSFFENALGAQNVGQAVAELSDIVGVVVHGGVDFLLKLVERGQVVFGDELADFSGIHDAQAWASSVTLSFFAVANSSMSLPSLNPAK